MHVELCAQMLRMLVSANFEDTFIFSTHHFLNAENFLFDLCYKLEMYVSTCEIIATHVSKQIQDKNLRLYLDFIWQTQLYFFRSHV